MATTRFLQFILLFTWVGMFTAACAPQRAKAIRDDRSLTLGLVGISYRPTGKIGLGTTYSGSGESSAKMSESSSGVGGMTVSSSSGDKYESYANRDVKSSYSMISPFVHYYPSDTSAFYVGLGASFYSARSKFNEETANSTALAPEYTEVDYQTRANYLGVPVGWAWIWESGFSLSLDFGPRFRINHSSTYENDGSAASVNSDKRDETKEYLDSRVPVMALGGSGIIGWSF